MVKAKVWVVNKKVVGCPTLKDFDCIEEDLPPCKDGDIVFEAEFLSVDPYMRYRMAQVEINSSLPSCQVSRVIESCNKDYPVGTYIIGYPGWRSHTHLTKQQLETPAVGGFPYMKLPDFGPVRRSAALGVLGMPGNTAYFGFLELCQPKAGEVVVVNGAAGAVGSLVCQIAKIKGCKVIAFAGTDEKVKWVKELGADCVFNYKKTNVSEAIKSCAPKGVDCYFDNVGGKFSTEVVPYMAEFGRISICGSISTYNDGSVESTATTSTTSPYLELRILSKQLRIEGFLVTRWISRWMEGLNQMKTWIQEGKIKYKETVTEGFEKMPEAFIGLFSGDNTGKAVVQYK